MKIIKKLKAVMAAIGCALWALISFGAQTASAQEPPDIGGQMASATPLADTVAGFVCVAGSPCQIQCKVSGQAQTYDGHSGAVVYRAANSDHLWLSLGGNQQILLGDDTLCDFSQLSRVRTPPPQNPITQPTGVPCYTFTDPDGHITTNCPNAGK